MATYFIREIVMRVYKRLAHWKTQLSSDNFQVKVRNTKRRVEYEAHSGGCTQGAKDTVLQPKRKCQKPQHVASSEGLLSYYSHWIMSSLISFLQLDLLSSNIRFYPRWTLVAQLTCLTSDFVTLIAQTRGWPDSRYFLSCVGRLVSGATTPFRHCSAKAAIDNW